MRTKPRQSDRRFASGPWTPLSVQAMGGGRRGNANNEHTFFPFFSELNCRANEVRCTGSRRGKPSDKSSSAALWWQTLNLLLLLVREALFVSLERIDIDSILLSSKCTFQRPALSEGKVEDTLNLGSNNCFANTQQTWLLQVDRDGLSM